MDQRIVEIADRYGYDAQSRQLIEEMAELTQAINKLWRKRLDCGKVEFTCEDEFREMVEETPEMESILQELADVEVCLDQMHYMLEADGKIERYKEAKICRQLRRIREEERYGICADDDQRLDGDQGQDQEGAEQPETLLRTDGVLSPEGQR